VLLGQSCILKVAQCVATCQVQFQTFRFRSSF